MIAASRRALRAILLLFLAFSSIILLSYNIRNHFNTLTPAYPIGNLSLWQAYYQPAHPGEYIAKTVDRRIYVTMTMTRTHTAWARVTTVSTVFLNGPSPAEHTHVPERHHVDEQARPPLANHAYRDDGLLQVNPDGPHPIYELIRRAEEKWQDKLNRASKTLDDAVREYHRRYKRPPPIGFDHWWDYMQKHNVQLPDEYDQIYKDIEHFWGMDPVDLRAIELEWESHGGDSYTIGKEKQGDPIRVLNYVLPGGMSLLSASRDFIKILQDVEDYIPPFRAVFTPHDNPNLHIDWELKQMALQAAREGTYININNPPPVKVDGWISACPPDSPARNASLFIPFDLSLPPPPPAHKTFIYDHRKTMDPCLHPSHLLLHGQFLSHHLGPVPHRYMPPQFSHCSTLLHHDITPPALANWAEDIEPRSDDPAWEDKDDERLQWRGSNTGIWYANDNRWWDSHRARLVRMVGAFEPEMPDSAAAFRHTNPTGHINMSGETLLASAPSSASDPAHGLVHYLPPWKSENEPVGEVVVAKRAVVNPALMDVAFVREPLNCKDELCDELKRVFEFRKPHGNREAGRYKYVVDVDGNGWSSRFKRLITSNSLIFKSTIYPEWFTDRVMPWVHFVPIQNDLSDLYDALVFFRGDSITWHQNGTRSVNDTLGGHEKVGGHDELAKNIATQGRKWSKTFWRREDMTAYIFRLMLEYTRVMSLDRESTTYHHVFTDQADRGSG